jgi:hypothetical protein
MGKKISGGGGLDREAGDKGHGNNSNAIAKLFKMIVLIVNFVIKVMEYAKKIIILIICYQNLVFNAWGGMDNAASKRRVLQSIKN